MKFSIVVLLSILHTFVKAQNCNCENELQFVTNYYETNLPGFTDNVNDSNRQAYLNFKEELKLKANKFCDDKSECFKLLTYYVEFFKDNHSGIDYNDYQKVNESNPKDLEEFLNSDLFKKHETIDLNSICFKKRELQSIQNTYQSKDSIYTVNIIEQKNGVRDYIGVITDSRTPLWARGQVKFELKKKANNKFDMLVYMRDHSIKYFNDIEFKNGILANNWFNTELKQRHTYNIDAPKDLIFKEINSQINYIHIPTFSGYWSAKLDSFYSKYDKAIQSKPYLIIDVRNNGGGSDDNANPLLKYIYSKPFYSDKVELYVTEENIRKSIEWYETNKIDTINFDKSFMKEIQEEIERMKKAPLNSFISRSDKQLIKLNQVLKHPKKIAVLMNRNCASSCESLLFWAMESSKCILMGENSGGYVGYGEIGSTTTPYFKFNLGCTMTRYDYQRAYESIGIPVQYYLNNNEDWIDQCVKILTNKK